MNRRRRSLYLGILLLIVALLLILYRTDSPAGGTTNSPDGKSATLDERMARNVCKLVYTKHARCRMDCRNISEEEVEEILVEGRINHAKSDIRSNPDPKYAFEGVTEDD